MNDNLCSLQGVSYSKKVRRFVFPNQGYLAIIRDCQYLWRRGGGGGYEEKMGVGKQNCRVNKILGREYISHWCPPLP